MHEINQVAKRFNNHARKYDNPWTSWLGERELRAVRRLVPANSQVLDYGCGTGRTTLDLLSRGCKVTAFDISTEMLHKAEVKANQKGFTAEFTSDESQLAAHTWQLVTCIGVTEYYSDPLPLLQTIGKYLDTGGKLVVTFPNALSPLGWFYFLGSRFTVPARPRTPGYALHICQRAGFRIEHFLYTLPPISPIGYTMVLGLTYCSQVPGYP